MRRRISRTVAETLTLVLVAAVVTVLGVATATPAAAATTPVVFGSATQTAFAHPSTGGSAQPAADCVSAGSTGVVTSLVGHRYNHSYLAGVTLGCAALLRDDNGNVVSGDSYAGPTYQGSDPVSDSQTAACPTGSVATGMIPQAGNVIDSLTLVCTALGADGTLGARSTAGPIGGTGGNPESEIDCPTGSIVTGMVGRTGADIDELAFTCRSLLPAQPLNSSWPTARTLNANDSTTQALSISGQNLWYRFPVTPGSSVKVDLTGLGANDDMALFTDIGSAFTSLTSTKDLLQLSAEFAPSAFSPSAFSPSAFSPSAFSPSAFSPSAFSPSAFSPSAFSPSAFSPSAFSPSAFSPSAFSPSAFSPSAFSPSAFSPSAFSADEINSPDFADAFSSAQTRSLISVSANDGTAPESITAQTWNNTGYFYVRVAGRNGATSPQPFTLTVNTGGGPCAGTPLDSKPSLDNTPGVVTGTTTAPRTIILTDPARMVGSAGDKATLAATLGTFADQVDGAVVDVSSSPRVAALQAQADAATACPYAQNLVAQAIRDIVNGYRSAGAPVQSVVVVGNDHVIPFFRYPDISGLGPESDYAPPVADSTASQASLRSNDVLSQDAYGTRLDVTVNGVSLPIPDKPVGRLIETPTDITRMLTEYLAGNTITPASTLVSGYDFLAGSADSVEKDFADGTAGSSATNDTLISRPGDPTPWTASALKNALLAHHHDLVYLAGHFSANSALAADFTTSLVTPDVAGPPTGTASPNAFANTLVISAGCHSGYNIVDGDGIPNVTVGLDWAQAFAEQGATLVAGTGYQYGDTDFLKYSAKLYADFSHDLRVGNAAAVGVGDALVAAKQQYLADTVTLSGIDEKALLESTLYGLPMTGVNFPDRVPAPTDTSSAGSAASVSTDPGRTLGLDSADITVTPNLTTHTTQLTDLSSPTSAQITATYLSGDDGVTGSPATPTLPLVSTNVTGPAGTVLRGVGFRSGTYADQTGVTPLTSAPATDASAAHAPFVSSAFYPNQLAHPNYFGALLSADGTGATRLQVTPAQYMSDGPGSLTDVQRSYAALGYRLFYSGNITRYGDNTPALAAPPSITGVTSTPSTDGSTLALAAHVVGDPSAGVQQVWVTYTATAGPLYGAWRSIDLVQDTGDSTAWAATLSLPSGQDASKVRFLVQAVNGVGLVGADDNQGSYYAPGPALVGNPPALQSPTLTVSAADTGTYLSKLTTTARLTDTSGAGIAGEPVTFTIGGASATATTDASGTATAEVPLSAVPGTYPLAATFAGDSTYSTAAASKPVVTVLPRTATLTLTPDPAPGGGVIATVTSGGAPQVQQTVVVVASNGTTVQTFSRLTDGTGSVRVTQSELPGGNPTIAAYFASMTPLPGGGTLDLTQPTWAPVSTSGLRPLQVSVAGVSDGATVAAGAFTATCLISDVYDGGKSMPATVSAATPTAVVGAGTQTAQCAYTDSHGFSDSASVTYTVTDTAPTVEKLSDPVPVDATDPRGAQVTVPTPKATDALDGTDPVSCDHQTGDWFAVGDTVVTCSATNHLGQTGSSTFTVHVTAPAPVVHVPANVQVSATGPQTPVSFQVTATDAVDGNRPVSCDHQSGDSFPLGTTTITCSATNSHGKQGTGSFTVTVLDDSTPILVVPRDQTREAAGPDGTAVSYVTSASTVGGTSLGTRCTPASGSTFAIGTTTVTCTATNPTNQNVGTGTFNVTVQDTTAPALTLPSTVQREATGPTTAVDFPASATDAVDGTDPVACTPGRGSAFAVGSTAVTCTAIDTHGNKATGVVTVTVTDTTAPALTVPSDMSVTATKATGAVVNYPAATARDLVDGSVKPKCAPASGTTFAPGTTTVSCTATDAHGNSATKTFVVTVTFGYGGVGAPLSDGGTYKQGSTIPVKFTLSGASANIADLQAQLFAAKVPPTGPVPVPGTAIGVFRLTGNHYQYNLSTGGLSVGTWQLDVDLGDGVPHLIRIILR